MKKLLCAALLACSPILFLNPTSANPVQFAQQVKPVELTELSFKSIIKTFYADTNRLRKVHLNPDVMKKGDEYAGVKLSKGWGLFAPKQNEGGVIQWGGMVQYKSISGEPRYLVVMDTSVIQEGEFADGHPIGSQLEFYSFRKLANHHYQLVTRSHPDIEPRGSWGSANWDATEFKKHLQSFGKNVLGSYGKDSYTSTGETESSWWVLLLPENDYIDFYKVADAAGDNEGNIDQTSSEYYNYDSTFKITANGQAYYPIQIHYTGTMPNDDFSKISKVNKTQTFIFNLSKAKYVLKKQD
ncbi:hypothetical protein [Acinetobacter sp. MB5]|uniref:hypothetical protein n=1 Tax=Acinetobacter sp. MB5 TaxID=2069438 RepID=UPI000DD0B774|nr:hypothetical protein [Acinetobacter sp. MB5]